MKSLKSIFSIGVAALAFAAGQSHATPFSLTAYGTITSGYDWGIFGGVGSSLVGQSFRETIAFDTAQNSTHTETQYYSTASGTNGNSRATVTASVNNHVYSTTFTDPYGTYASIYNFLTQLGGVYPGYPWDDGVFSTACSDPSLSTFACAELAIDSTVHPFLSSHALDQVYSYTLQPGVTSTAWFTADSEYLHFADFQGTITSFSLNAVPEPATLALVMFGLFAMAALGRRNLRA